MDFKAACKEVAKLLNEDPNVVQDVVSHLFKFIRAVMNDPSDTHDILINKAFRFKLKPRFKEDKTKKYSAK